MVDVGWAAHLLPLAAAGFAVGMLVGLTGVGGGALMTPLLISSFGVPPQVAVGTDLLYASITKTAGGWRHHLSDHIDWPIVLRLAAGSLPAAALLLAVMAFLPVDTVKLAHWIRMGLRPALKRACDRALSFCHPHHAARRQGRRAAAHTSHGPVRRGVRAARHADLGRLGRDRRHRACRALPRAAWRSGLSARISPMPCRSPCSAASAISASAIWMPAFSSRCYAGRSPAFSSARGSPEWRPNGCSGRSSR
jgi:Sulfite exporter TauE/SafE